MGVSLNLVFKKKVSPYGTLGDDHNVLGNGLTQLDKVLSRAGLPTLGQFVSCDPADWIDIADEDPHTNALPPEHWFKATEGLKAVRAILAYLRA